MLLTKSIGIKLKLPLILISLISLPSILLSQEQAKVISINRAKGAVRINQGRVGGLIPGNKICFFDENQDQRACGQVKVVKEGTAIVYLGKSVEKIEGKEVAVLSNKNSPKPSKQKKHSSVVKPFTLRLLWLPDFFAFPPSTYNVIAYNALDATPVKDRNQETNPLPYWTSTGAFENSAGSSMMKSFGLELSIGQLWNFGIAYKPRPSLKMSADYDRDTRCSFKSDGYFCPIYMESVISGQGVGFWTTISLINAKYYSTGIGLTYDYLAIDLAATKKDSDDESMNELMYQYGLSQHIVSLSIPLRGKYDRNRYSLSAGINLSIPLFMIDSTLDSKKVASDPKIPNQSEGFNDLASSIGSKKNYFSFEFVFGPGYHF